MPRAETRTTLRWGRILLLVLCFSQSGFSTDVGKNCAALSSVERVNAIRHQAAQALEIRNSVLQDYFQPGKLFADPLMHSFFKQVEKFISGHKGRQEHYSYISEPGKTLEPNEVYFYERDRHKKYKLPENFQEYSPSEIKVLMVNARDGQFGWKTLASPEIMSLQVLASLRESFPEDLMQPPAEGTNGLEHLRRLQKHLSELNVTEPQFRDLGKRVSEFFKDMESHPEKKQAVFKSLSDYIPIVQKIEETKSKVMEAEKALLIASAPSVSPPRWYNIPPFSSQGKKFRAYQKDLNAKWEALSKANGELQNLETHLEPLFHSSDPQRLLLSEKKAEPKLVGYTPKDRTGLMVLASSTLPGSERFGAGVQAVEQRERIIDEYFTPSGLFGTKRIAEARDLKGNNGTSLTPEHIWMLVQKAFEPELLAEEPKDAEHALKIAESLREHIEKLGISEEDFHKRNAQVRAIDSDKELKAQVFDTILDWQNNFEKFNQIKKLVRGETKALARIEPAVARIPQTVKPEKLGRSYDESNSNAPFLEAVNEWTSALGEYRDKARPDILYKRLAAISRLNLSNFESDLSMKAIPALSREILATTPEIIAALDQQSADFEQLFAEGVVIKEALRRHSERLKEESDRKIDEALAYATNAPDWQKEIILNRAARTKEPIEFAENLRRNFEVMIESARTADASVQATKQNVLEMATFFQLMSVLGEDGISFSHRETFVSTLKELAARDQIKTEKKRAGWFSNRPRSATE
jgi:hypothetical protein